MMPIKNFDPMQQPSGLIQVNGINPNEQILLFNSSQACLLLEFTDKTQDNLPPGWVKSWTKPFPIINIKYSTQFTLGMPGQPVSLLYGTVYEDGEHVQPVNAPLQYVFNINT